MTQRRLLFLAIVPLALTSATGAGPRDAPPPARVTGPPESCVSVAQLHESRIRDDWTIDFMRDGRRAWRVTLPQRCNGLKSADAFSYRTSLTQLCSSDIIHVLEHWGNELHEGAGCGMGPFVPVELEK
jgi:hypothetical protein